MGGPTGGGMGMSIAPMPPPAAWPRQTAAYDDADAGASEGERPPIHSPASDAMEEGKPPAGAPAAGTPPREDDAAGRDDGAAPAAAATSQPVPGSPGIAARALATLPVGIAGIDLLSHVASHSR